MIGQQTLLAQKYAQAYLNCFAHSLQPADLGQLQQLRRFVAEPATRTLLVYFFSRPAGQAQALINQLVQKFQLPAHFARFLTLLAQHKAIFLLDKVLTELLLLYQISAKNYWFTVQTVAPLTTTQQQVLVTYLTQALTRLLRTPATVSCDWQLAPQLIAGIRATNQLFYWDSSVQGRLQKLETTLRLNY